ncbi:MAG: CotH kinase family protein, partial [Cyclobacteriaceae bacterium]|nr:CotH kinase family protein [Cyclobacteriaceae bacterium]
NFIYSADISNNQNYQIVEQKVDIDNFILYNIAQIFFGNRDWPGNNIKFWKHNTGKWRWILYDTDFGFGIWNNEAFTDNTLAFALEENGPGWPNPPWSTLFLRRFVTNTTFKHKFINRFADMLNSSFHSDTTINRLNAYSNTISNEIIKHMDRWGGSMYTWNNKISVMRIFANKRPTYIRSFISQEFNLKAEHEIFIDIAEEHMGSVKLNTITINHSNWQGIYFEDVPITVTAIPNEGYTFSHWSGYSHSPNPQLHITMTDTLSLTAHFVQSANPIEKIVINEINYNSIADDWVELYNPNENYIDISGWNIRDSENEHNYRIPEGTVLGGRHYIVIARDRNKFRVSHPAKEKVLIGDFIYGLSSFGDEVRLFNKQGTLIDSVFYLPTSPWPLMAHGGGATLELIDPFLDNTLGENWSSFSIGGSPGQKNGFLVSNFIEEKNVFLEIYPNPMKDVGLISLQIEKDTQIELFLSDITGKSISNFNLEKLSVGKYQFALNMEGLNNGIYLLTCIKDNEKYVYRIIKAE